jgi:hypothetical protein
MPTLADCAARLGKNSPQQTSSFRDGPSGPDPESMNTGSGKAFESLYFWIPGSRPCDKLRNARAPEMAMTFGFLPSLCAYPPY